MKIKNKFSKRLLFTASLFLFLFLFSLNFVSADIYSETDIYGKSKTNITHITITNYFTNSSEYWITDEGALDNVVDILGSWINNDLNWITNAVNDLVNYYTKTQSDERYLQSYTETDPFWSANQSSYLPLIDNSIVNALHRHSELVASDGSPDPALMVNALGRVGIGTTTPQQKLHVNGSAVINGTLNMDSNKIISLGNGTSAQDAVTLSQLQAVNESAVAEETDPLWTGNYSGLTSGQVLFGQLEQDGNLTWDDTNKRLGIGTTSPDTILNIAGSGEMIRIEASVDATNRIEFGADSSILGGYINMNRADGQFQLRQGGTAKLVLDENGNVGIGITSPSYLLDVVSDTGSALLNLDKNASTDEVGVIFSEAGTERWKIKMKDTSARHLLFYDVSTGTTPMTIENNPPSNMLYLDSSGNVGINTTSPKNKLNIIGAVNATTGFISGAYTGLTGNYSVGTCWFAYAGGIMYSTNCTAL